jgi:type I restriction enzyme, S subunit
VEVNGRKMPVREATSTNASSIVPQGYKCTDVGIVPEDWQVMSLGDVAAMDVGYAFKSVWFHPDDGIRLLRGENVGYGHPDWSDTQRLPPKLAQTFNQYILRPGDIVIGMDRTFTKTGTKISLLEQSDCPSLLVQRVGRFVPRTCTGRYLWTLLSSEDFRKALRAEQKGMDLPHLSRLEILSMRVAFPPNEPEQEAIGEALSDVDALLGALEALIAKKRAIKEGAMQQLLTGNTRLPGFSGNWETKRIAEIASPFGERNSSGRDLPVLACSKHSGFVDSLRYFKNQVFSSDLSAYKLISRGQIGYPANHIEEGSIGLQDLYDVALVSPIYVVFSPAEWINSYFLHRLLKLDSYRQKFGSATNSSVDRRGSLKWPAFSEITVTIPSSEEQIAIASVLSDVDTELAALETRRDKMRAIKQGMMQQLLTGRIRLVKPQPAETEA